MVGPAIIPVYVKDEALLISQELQEYEIINFLLPLRKYDDYIIIDRLLKVNNEKIKFIANNTVVRTNEIKLKDGMYILVIENNTIHIFLDYSSLAKYCSIIVRSEV